MTLTKTVIDPHTSPLEGAAAPSCALEAEMSCFILICHQCRSQLFSVNVRDFRFIRRCTAVENGSGFGNNNKVQKTLKLSVQQTSLFMIAMINSINMITK